MLNSLCFWALVESDQHVLRSKGRRGGLFNALLNQHDGFTDTLLLQQIYHYIYTYIIHTDTNVHIYTHIYTCTIYKYYKYILYIYIEREREREREIET